MQDADVKDAPAVQVAPPADPNEAPVRRIDQEQMKVLGMSLSKLFDQYASDRTVAEQKWLKNLRQYLGVYDPEIEQTFKAGRSRAYPRVTRVKCISVLSRIMNLMFPGNEKNWTLGASPSPDMDPEDVQLAIEKLMQDAADTGEQPQVDDKMVKLATEQLARERARQLEKFIDDQLQEIGGDQTVDYVALNRSVLKSGIMYGLGVMRGPFVRKDNMVTWQLGEDGKPMAKQRDVYKPMFEFLPIWDFYPDMSAKTLSQMDGYFIRMVMSRSQVRDLARRKDFFGDVIKSYLSLNRTGNYKPRNYESMLRNLGVRENVNEMKAETSKYELIVWNGPISGAYLEAAGVEVPAEKISDDFDAEIWMLDGKIVKCDINTWVKLGVGMKQVHCFVFDEDDTSPVGNGLPAVIRDSQMAICAATRMLLDNASVICGPNLEINWDLMRPDQDITSVEAYKIWYREGMGADANVPAVRNIQIDSHIDELMKVVDLFMKFADQETFVGPQTGGDMDRMKSSEPMRSAAGASQLRSDAALPFKDIVRSFDTFTQSVIYSLVLFNLKFNPDRAPSGDYDVIARGATSLIAKEVRGMQLDQLVSTLTDEEKMEIDTRKLARARFAIRDLDDMLVDDVEAEKRRRARDAAAAEASAAQKEMMQAELRSVLSDAFKNISQGQKNSAAADAQTVNSAISLLQQGMDDAAKAGDAGNEQAAADSGPAAKAAA